MNTPIVNTNDFNTFQNLVQALAIAYNQDPNTILRIGMLTHISNQIMPNYKHYKHIISGITQARMINGRSGKYSIVNNIELLERNYDLLSINENILDRAIDLVVTTFDSIYEHGGDRIKSAYSSALNDPEFLFINLNLSVKILGQHLRNNNIDLSNKTLQYMTDAIKNEKKKLVQNIIDAYITGIENNVTQAKIEYHNGMNQLLNNYLMRLDISVHDANQFGMEQNIANRLGQAYLDNVILGLLIEMKERILVNNQLQMQISF